jgi:hypothetical protein
MTVMMKIMDDGDGYRLRINAERIGTFKVVAIDWEHPNYGYFMDAMLWIRSPHMDRWVPLNIAKWTERYDTLRCFLTDYPEFSEFFEFDSIEKIRKTCKKGLISELRRYSNGRE